MLLAEALMDPGAEVVEFRLVNYNKKDSNDPDARCRVYRSRNKFARGPPFMLSRLHVKLKEYSGDPRTWGEWYTSARGDLGNNRWLHVAERPVYEPLTTETEKQINTSLFWQLRRACVNGSRSGIITDFDPPAGAQYAQGREAWQALVGKVNTKLQLDCQATVWNRKLLDLVITHKFTTTMAKHVNDFNS